MTKPLLAPCPYCQNEDIEYTSSAPSSPVWNAVRCPDCGMRGPVFTSANHAGAAWNDIADAIAILKVITGRPRQEFHHSPELARLASRAQSIVERLQK